MALHLQRGTYDPVVPVRAWVVAIARHEMVELWRRRSRLNSLRDAIDDVDEQLHALSLPALAASFWPVGGLASAQPRAASVAAGLMAGSVGAFGYALACPASSLVFVAAWCTLGIAFTGVVGAATGLKVLCW